MPDMLNHVHYSPIATSSFPNYNLHLSTCLCDLKNHFIIKMEWTPHTYLYRIEGDIFVFVDLPIVMVPPIYYSYPCIQNVHPTNLPCTSICSNIRCQFVEISVDTFCTFVSFVSVVDLVVPLLDVPQNFQSALWLISMWNKMLIKVKEIISD